MSCIVLLSVFIQLKSISEIFSGVEYVVLSYQVCLCILSCFSFLRRSLDFPSLTLQLNLKGRHPNWTSPTGFFQWWVYIQRRRYSSLEKFLAKLFFPQKSSEKPSHPFFSPPPTYLMKNFKRSFTPVSDTYYKKYKSQGCQNNASWTMMSNTAFFCQCLRIRPIMRSIPEWSWRIRLE